MYTTIIQRLLTIEQLIKDKGLHSKDALTAKEAADYLGLSLSALYKKTSKKTLPYYCPGGKKLYFKKSELDSYLLSNKKSSVEEIEKSAANYVTSKRRDF